MWLITRLCPLFQNVRKARKTKGFKAKRQQFEILFITRKMILLMAIFPSMLAP